jgi:hypothetical protein
MVLVSKAKLGVFESQESSSIVDTFANLLLSASWQKELEEE